MKEFPPSAEYLVDTDTRNVSQNSGTILWFSGSVLNHPWSGTEQVEAGELDQVREAGAKKLKVFVLIMSDVIEHGVEAKK